MSIYKIHKGANSFAITEEKESLRKLKDNEVLIEQHAVGLNSEDIVDIAFRKEKDSWIPCYEACGIIEEVGESVRRFRKGDLVAYAINGFGALRQRRIMNAEHIIAIPDFDSVFTAGSLRKYLIAHSCILRAYIFSPGSVVMVNQPTSPVAIMIAKVAQHRSASVIAYSDKESEYELARNMHLYEDVMHVPNIEDAKKLRESMVEKGVRAIYDGLGGDETAKSLLMLGYFGAVIQYSRERGLPSKIHFNDAIRYCSTLVMVDVDKYKEKTTEVAIAMAEMNHLYSTIGGNLIKVKEFSIDKAKDAFDALISGRDNPHSLVIKMK